MADVFQFRNQLVVLSDDDKHRNRPFQMWPMHSTTFKVLEILVGDIACLIDRTAVESFHPGFFLHDTLREAEMSESMLWALLGHVASGESDAFQYIVTTSTEPAETFKPFERFRLSSGSEWPSASPPRGCGAEAVDVRNWRVHRPLVCPPQRKI